MKKGSPNKKPISDTIAIEDSQTETPLSPFAEFVKKWILFRIPTFFAWMWFIWKVFGIELPIEQRFESYFVIPYLVVFGLFVITIHWNLAFGYPFYFIFSPLLLIIQPVLFIIKTYRSSSDELSSWSNGLGKFLLFLRSYKFIIILALLSISGWTAMAFYVSPANRPFLALASHIITYLLFLQSFRWAANPYKPILLGLSLASKIVEKVLN